MAFKGESDDIRSSLSYKLKRILEFRAARGALHRPLRHGRRLAAAARRGHRAVRRPHHRRPAPAVPATSRPSVSRRRRVEPARARARPYDVAVTVVIPAYNEGDAIVPVLDRIFEAVESDREVLVVVDFAEDTTVPVLAQYRRHEPRLQPTRQHLRPRPGERHPLRHRPRHAPGRRRDDGRRLRRPAPDRPARPPRRPRRRGGRRVALLRGGQQVGGPLLKGLLSRTAGRSLACSPGSAPATPPTASRPTPPIRPRGRHPQPQRLRDRHRADRQGSPAAPPGRGDPHDLARPHHRRLQLRPEGWIPKYLRWYRFAFGPQLTVDEVQPRPRASPPSTTPHQEQMKSMREREQPSRKSSSPARPASSAATSSRSS